MRFWSDKWIGGCLKFLLEAWSLSLHQFARHWASGSVVLRPKQPCIMMTEGLLRQNGQVISISCLVPGLLTYSFCQPWMGSPLHPVTLGEWYGLCGVYCEVIWEETAFGAPAKKRQPPSAHLLAPASVSPLSALLFLQQDCPHVVTTGNADNELSRTEPDTQTVFVMAVVQYWTWWQVDHLSLYENVSRKCRRTWGRTVWKWLCSISKRD